MRQTSWRLGSQERKVRREGRTWAGVAREQAKARRKRGRRVLDELHCSERSDTRRREWEEINVELTLHGEVES